MDVEKEAAARQTRGSQRLDGRRRGKRRERRGGGGRGEEAWRAAAGAGRGGQDQPRCGPARRSPPPHREVAPGGPRRRTSASPSPGVASRPPPSLAPPARRQRGSPARAAVCWGSTSETAVAQRPDKSTDALAVGTITRRGRGVASITADLPRPPCWKETTRHAEAERLQRRKPRRGDRLRRPGAAAAPGGRGRRTARVERPSRSALLRWPDGASLPPAFSRRAG